MTDLVAFHQLDAQFLAPSNKENLVMYVYTSLSIRYATIWYAINILKLAFTLLPGLVGFHFIFACPFYFCILFEDGTFDYVICPLLSIATGMHTLWHKNIDVAQFWLYPWSHRSLISHHLTSNKCKGRKKVNCLHLGSADHDIPSDDLSQSEHVSEHDVKYRYVSHSQSHCLTLPSLIYFSYLSPRVLWDSVM